MEQDNNRRNGEFIKQYTKQSTVNYWGKWRVDNANYPKSKVTEAAQEIDSALTDFVHYIIKHSNYSAEYILSVSVVEFYAILKRIDREVSDRAAQIKKLK